MRVLILALMIALLPLRGWVGDTMAVHSGVAAAAGAMPADCPMLAQADNTASAACACDSCALCLPLVAVASRVDATAQAPVRDRAAANPDRFASAERVPGFKPPIS